MRLPTTQEERDRLELVDAPLRFAIDQAKRRGRSLPLVACAGGCGRLCRGWQGIETPRVCHVCMELRRMAAAMIR